MQHLRYLTLYIVGSLVIITEMLAAYVLQPSSTLWLMLILLVLVAVVTLVGIVVQMAARRAVLVARSAAQGTRASLTAKVMTTGVAAVRE